MSLSGTVWVVSSGMNYEGGQAIGVFDSEESAEKHCLEQPFYGDPWCQVRHEPGKVSVWQSGSDYVEYERFEVLP